MNREPIDINLDRTSVAIREKQARRRPLGLSQPKSIRHDLASPEAFDEVFASLSQKPFASRAGESSMASGRPVLYAAPLLALSASLERQHDRLADLLREIETVE